MKKSFLLVVIVFFLLFIQIISVYANNSFEYHGYARSGFSFNEKMNQVNGAMQTPSSPTKYRLGNEQNSSNISATFVKNWQTEKGKWFKLESSFDWRLDETHPYGNDTSKSDGGEPARARIRELAVEAGGLSFAPNILYWVGLQQYAREDIHVNDLFYRDLTSFGAGVSNINIYFADLSLAWLAPSATDLDTRDGDKATGNATVHWYDIQINNIELPVGSINLETAIIYLPGGGENDFDNDTDETIYTNLDNDAENEFVSTVGYFCEISYVLNSFLFFSDGFTKFVAQYGAGPGAGSELGSLGTVGSAMWSQFATSKTGDVKTIDDRYSYRAIVWGKYDISYDVILMPVFVHQVFYKETNDTNGDIVETTNTWTSFGARIKYCFNEDFALLVEAGHDIVKTKVSNSGTTTTKPALTKVTIAPALIFDIGFYARPEIRVYATYGRWNDDAKADVPARSNDDDKDAWQFGFQFEAWW